MNARFFRAPSSPAQDVGDEALGRPTSRPLRQAGCPPTTCASALHRMAAGRHFLWNAGMKGRAGSGGAGLLTRLPEAERALEMRGFSVAGLAREAAVGSVSSADRGGRSRFPGPAALEIPSRPCKNRLSFLR